MPTCTTRYAEYFPHVHQEGRRRPSCSTRSCSQFDLASSARRSTPTRDLQFDYLGLQTLYDRYFLHVDEARIELPQAFFMRVAMGLALERDRPRGARHRVLRRAVDLRLHELDADAVQRRHAPLAAVELLPDDRRRRPRRHLRGAEGKRAAVQVRRRPGQRLDQRARARLATSRAPTARARAWCRS